LIRKIVPSILSCDFAIILKQIRDLQKLGVDIIHIDVMDGHFVPNITFGPCVISSLRKHLNLTFDVHLMITNVEKFLCKFIESGADIVTFHLESINKRDLIKIINEIKKSNIKPGISIKPSTPVDEILPYLKYLYLVLVMTVEPGFGGQKFIEECKEKILKLRNYIDKNNYKCLIEVDGGINESTVKDVIEAGANLFVCGNVIFGKQDYKKAYLNFKNNFKKFSEL